MTSRNDCRQVAEKRGELGEEKSPPSEVAPPKDPLGLLEAGKITHERLRLVAPAEGDGLDLVPAIDDGIRCAGEFSGCCGFRFVTGQAGSTLSRSRTHYRRRLRGAHFGAYPLPRASSSASRTAIVPSTSPAAPAAQ